MFIRNHTIFKRKRGHDITFKLNELVAQIKIVSFSKMDAMCNSIWVESLTTPLFLRGLCQFPILETFEKISIKTVISIMIPYS